MKDEIWHRFIVNYIHVERYNNMIFFLTVSFLYAAQPKAMTIQLQYFLLLQNLIT